jgi:hypothetical protein
MGDRTLAPKRSSARDIVREERTCDLGWHAWSNADYAPDQEDERHMLGL